MSKSKSSKSEKTQTTGAETPAATEESQAKQPEMAETPTAEPKPSRIEQFLKEKAARGQQFSKDSQVKPFQSKHTKLKERIRRRP